MKQTFYFVKKLHAFSGKILYINLLAMIFISLLEGIGILFLIPMITASGIVKLDATGIPLSHWFEIFHKVPALLELPLILGIYVLLVIGQTVFQNHISIRNAKIQHGFTRHLRLETYGSILQANWDFFMKSRKSDLINLLTSELARVSAGTHTFLQFIASIIFTLAQVSLAFWLSPRITVFVLVSGLLLILISRKFLGRSLKFGNSTFELGQSYLAGVTDQINGIKDIKSNRLERARMDWYVALTERMRNEQVAYTKLQAGSSKMYKVSSAVLIAVFIYISVNLFRAQPEQLLLVIIIFSRLWPRFIGIQSSMAQIAVVLPSFKALVELHEQCAVVREFKEGMDHEPKEQRIHMKQGINLENVCFRYNLGEPAYALQKVDLHIPANRMTAIVGHSGAGKSTLVDVVMGLLKPESGSVMIDGIPLTDDILLSLRESLGYVSQDPFLFNTSIRDNLLMVKPHAQEEQLWEALQFSSAADFVRKLPQGLDTLIGDRGVRLSGGERQRLILARAMLKKPSILILDEATSALDNENEAKIQEVLEQVKGKMTIIVIAHRLSTIRDADEVIVMDEGKIIQVGKYEKLAKEKKGVFSFLDKYELMTVQKAENFS
ncbi:Heterocyst differentiation ATP-binding protein HepA [Paenibacillus allorhizoplanae]|uniref:Heterocyst differentiation ATP-binding protein HepA n=1 Tax=Paenibacillus allorhizoplanae TaxID=2905648 RepID=A0ABM9CYN1_9BACL|nr:ABC transporter ATP-binding protein [Paenibacillus allorhizoplanae]CAH1227126.1 Heterocyst differentiation ATP-binding protein HepA [Paenibacillus allorhizoplanae]